MTPDDYQAVAITRTSDLSGKRRTQVINMRWSDYINWREGGIAIQDALPYLLAEEREFLMTGITPDDWAAVFGERPAEEGTRNG